MSGGPHRKKPRTLRARALSAIRAKPTAIHYLIAAAMYGFTIGVVDWLQNVPLPHDGLYTAVVYLASGGRSQTPWPKPTLVTIATSINIVGALLLVASAVLPQARRFARIHAVASRFYKYAIALPLWTLLVANLDRLLTNETNSFTQVTWYDVTHVFARIEGPLIGWFQHAIAGSALTTLAWIFASIVWLAPVAFAGGVLVIADRARILNSLIVVYVLAGLLAVPIFVLFPASEPWTTNASYGADVAATSIRYLHGTVSVSTLTRINTHFHSATRSAFPSLHVAVIIIGGLVFRRHRMRMTSLVLFGMAGLTALVGLYLGRSWLLGSVTAIPFSLAVVALGKRFPLDVSLRQRCITRGVLRPGEIAVVDTKEHEVQWLFSGYYTRELRKLSRDVWRSLERTRERVTGLLSFKSSNRRQRRRRR